jgi:hypothetical protein
MFKLDNGAELFSSQDMERLRTASSGVMGNRSWVDKKEKEGEKCLTPGCRCQGKCRVCSCREKAGDGL